MGPAGCSRRGFFGVAGATIGFGMAWPGALARGQQGQPPANPPSQMVRQNIAALSDQQISSLKNGVAAMKARSRNDPTSWSFQANIHGTTGPAFSALFNQCEHGTIFFLAWHRGYLYFFERILRAAANDPNLTLPYWDWSTNPALPAVFRSPDPNNPLFDETRQINDGSLLPSSVVVDDLNTALASIPFDPDGATGFSPSLENSPHGAVHTLVGGRMAFVPTAANDPIFWLHHGNIDRNWDRWLNMVDGRMNPTDTSFLGQRYSYADVGGQTVTVSVRDIINSVQLGYRYDNVPSPTAATIPAAIAMSATRGLPSREGAPQQAVIVASSSPPSIRGQAAAEGKPLGFKAETVKLSMEPEARPTLRSAVAAAAPSRPRKILLDIEGISFSSSPNFTYQVFLNLPDSAAASDQARLHHVGTIHFFRSEHISKNGHDTQAAPVSKQPQTFNQTFDVTPVVARLRESGRWSDDALSVTIRPLTPTPPSGKEADLQRRCEKAAAQAKVSYQRIQLRVIP
jgi:hypothetical protein